MKWRKRLIMILAGCSIAANGGLAEEAATKQPVKKVAEEAVAKKLVEKTEEKVAPGSRKKEPLYDVARLAPRVTIELRYATDRNLAKRAIYPPGARCLVRESVAERLVVAQAYLKQHAPPGTTLKIWDGYRPAWAQKLLWKTMPNKEYLGDPRRLGSLHTWGVCVDVTLCDAEGRDLKMPTDFDVLTPEAGTFYEGKDRTVRRHLYWLQAAMHQAGFLVVRDEWWHFVARDHEAFGPLDVSLTEPLKSERP